MDTPLNRYEPSNLNQEVVNRLNKPLRKKKAERVIKSSDKKKSPPQMDLQQNSLKLSKQI